jgi:hypothetical protein
MVLRLVVLIVVIACAKLSVEALVDTTTTERRDVSA